MKYCKGHVLMIVLCFGFLLIRAQTIVINVTGLRNHEGDMIVALYNDRVQFPNDPFMTVIQDKSSTQKDTLVFRISGLEEGNYAVSVLDDENANDAMDKRLLVPREGFCFSRFVPDGLKCPIWDNCCFALDGKDVTITLQLYYF